MDQWDTGAEKEFLSLKEKWINYCSRGGLKQQERKCEGSLHVVPSGSSLLAEKEEQKTIIVESAKNLFFDFFFVHV